MMILKTDCAYSTMWSCDTERNCYIIEQDKATKDFTYSINGEAISKPCRTHIKIMQRYGLPYPKRTAIVIDVAGETNTLEFSQGNIRKCIGLIKASITTEFTVLAARVY